MFAGKSGATWDSGVGNRCECRADLSAELQPRREIGEVVEETDRDDDRAADGHALEPPREIEVREHGHGERELRFLARSEEHTSELQSRLHLVCRLLLEKKKKIKDIHRCL